MVNRYSFSYFCRKILILLLFFPLTAMAKTTALLERETIEQGETVRLLIESDIAGQTAKPDLSVLNPVFEVLGTSVSHNITVVNGRQVTSRRWVVELEPRATGVFTIAPITVAYETTQGLRLNVLPRQGNPQGEDIFIEVEADKDEVYVQEMITLTIRLFLGVEIVNGSLSDPAARNIELLRLGNDVSYTKRVNNRNYRIVERKYALFPQASGALEIPEISFRGTVNDRNNGGNQIFGRLFNQGKTARAYSKPFSITVVPPNSQSVANWLPARDLQIIERSGEQRDLQVGEPYTRQIEIRAQGLMAEQLPDFEPQNAANLKQYPDKVQRENRIDNQVSVSESLTGIVQQGIAIIPQKSGEITLPAVEIEWWDVVNDQPRKAVLAEQVLTVIEPPQSASSTAASLQADTPFQGDAPFAPDVASQSAAHGDSFWRWATLVMFALWLVTCLFFWRSIRRTDKNTVQPDKQENPTGAQILKEIEQHCLANDARAVWSALCKWAAIIQPHQPSASVRDLVNQAPAGALRDALQELENCLYADGAADSGQIKWDGSAIRACLPELSKMGDSDTVIKPGLQPLYFAADSEIRA